MGKGFEKRIRADWNANLRRDLEDEVVYTDGGAVRRLRGKIVSEDAAFLTLQRDDGLYELAKSTVLKIIRRTQGARA